MKRTLEAAYSLLRGRLSSNYLPPHMSTCKALVYSLRIGLAAPGNGVAQEPNVCGVYLKRVIDEQLSRVGECMVGSCVLWERDRCCTQIDLILWDKLGIEVLGW